MMGFVRGTVGALFLSVIPPFCFAAAPAAAPTVVSTAPADGESNVVLGAGICVTFSTAMDTAATEAAFSVLPAVPGSFSWNGATLTFLPSSDLSPSTAYQVNIGAGAQDSLGNPMGAPFTATFATGVIVGTPLPAGPLKTLLHFGATQADRVTGLVSSEMQPLIDPFQVGGMGYDHLQQPADARPVPLANVASTQTPMVWSALTDGNGDGIWDDGQGGITYAALYLVVPTPRKAAIAATFDDKLTVWLDGAPTPVFANLSPSPAFDLSQGVHVVVIKHAQTGSYSLRFTDEGGADLTDLRYVLDDVLPPRVRSTLPASGATAVLAGTDVVIQFSEAMDTTVAASAVAALTGGAATGAWSWTDSRTLVWTPAAPLDFATVYTVTLTSAQAKDLRGSPLAGSSSFSFTTAALSTPSAISILPTSAVSGATVNLATVFGSGFQQGVVVHPAGAVPMGGHYYRLSSTFNSWGAAQAACLAQGGHLATLGSLEEDTFVWKLSGYANAWLGQSDVYAPGGWQWVTGEPATYTNWFPGEPNNWIGQGEHWASYWYGFGWNDIYDGARAYVCEFEGASSPAIRLKRAGQADIVATNVVFNSSGSISFSLNLAGAFPGAWDVVLTNPDGAVTTLAGAFTVLPPPPTVTNVTSTNADGTYGPGDSIIVDVTFSAPVTTAGTPQVKLETGTTDRFAIFVGGAGTAHLLFEYLVTAGDASNDLDCFSTSALSLNGATIKDISGTDAILTLPAPGAAGSLGANKNIKIVTPPPPAATVTNVTSTTPNGTYGPGDTVFVVIQFSSIVIATGTPQLKLETGTTDRVIPYAGGAGTTQLSFEYFVFPGESSSDLDCFSASALTLNGGTIKDGFGTDAVLTLPAPGATGSLGANKNIRIASPPAATVTNVTSPAADGAYGPGVGLSIVVQFSAAVNVTGTPRLTLETGAVDAQAVFAGGSGTSSLTFTYWVAAGETSPDLDYVSTSALALNGGAIWGAGSVDADLTLPAPGTVGSLGANKDLQIGSSSAPPPKNVTMIVKGCGLTGAEGILLLLLLRRIRNRSRRIS